MDLNINVCTLWGKSEKIMSLTTPNCFYSPLCCHGGVCHIPIKHCGVIMFDHVCDPLRDC